MLSVIIMSEKWTTLPDEDTVRSTAEAIRSNGINVIVLEKGSEALDYIRKVIPRGSEVMMGGSVTLEQIGFKNYLASGGHRWKNLYAETCSETDPQKRSELRRKAVIAEYFVGGLNAITRKGELVACDMSGSRVGAYPFAAKNLILVSSTQKITSDLQTAMCRVREYALPLTSKMVKEASGFACCISKWVIIENETIKGRITLILIREKLGY